MIRSQLAKALVCGHATPHTWPKRSVQETLLECIGMRDLVGAEAVYGKLDAEHKCLFGDSYHNMIKPMSLVSGTVEHLVRINCREALGAVRRIRRDLGLPTIR